MKLQGTTSGQHSFAQTPKAEIPRSSFDRSYGMKTAFDSGLLIPVMVEEVLPGDTVNVTMHNFARLATPLHPIMDNMYLDSHFFFVPLRLVWDNFKKFMGEQNDPGDSTDYVTPVCNTGATGIMFDSIYDYMGIPTWSINLDFSALPTRAYALIWNEWFRDENLQDSITVNKGDADDPLADVELQRRGKRHDYFTSALPWPQKGPSVEIPLGDSAPVVPTGTGLVHWDIGGNTQVGPQSVGTSITLNLTESVPLSGGGFYSTPTNLEVDLSTATAATINSLRQAFQVQKLYERDARGGSRYTEIVRSHFGVVSPDARLQRPEYLGGGSQNISVTPVPQTSQSDTTVQGNLTAYGTSSSAGANHSFNKSFTEHGLIIGMVSVRADLNYQSGLDRKWSRISRFDYYWPALAHIGEQAILNKEIFASDVAERENAFGYQERFAEYRYSKSLITGRMNSAHPQSLDTWHLAQDFSTLPVLDDAFITETPPIDRIIAVVSEPEFLFDAFFDMKMARPMPTYGVPGNMDRF